MVMMVQPLYVLNGVGRTVLTCTHLDLVKMAEFADGEHRGVFNMNVGREAVDDLMTEFQ
jgi:hypothetical protein